MAEPRRVHAAPRSAVLWVYDPDREAPQVEPAPDSLVVLIPSTATDVRAQLEEAFHTAAEAMGLKLPRPQD